MTSKLEYWQDYAKQQLEEALGKDFANLREKEVHSFGNSFFDQALQQEVSKDQVVFLQRGKDSILNT